MLVNLEQVQKYNVPTPRYTSYPPANHFTASIDPARIAEEIRSARGSRTPISLYVHIPFCKTLCWYCGCNTIITKNQSRSAEYLWYLSREIEAVAELAGPTRTVSQIHLGGGTPTFLLPSEIRDLGAAIASHFRVSPNVEASVEIDPRRMSNEHVLALRDAGLNRVSIGVQDFASEVQKAVNRIQSYELTANVIDWVRKAGFTSVAVDLIYGLPYQTVESFNETLDRVLTLSPDRLAVFSYAHVPWLKPAQKLLERKVLPDVATKLALMKLAVEKLTANGYVYIGMDHFAKPGDEIVRAQQAGELQRNFQGYSTCAGADIYAFGVSGLSQTARLYWQNTKDLGEYYAAIKRGELPVANGYAMTGEDQLRREVIMRLMCDLRLDYSAASQALGLDFREHFAAEIDSLEDLEAGGLLVRSPEGIEVTEAGRLLIRNIASRFDAHLRTGGAPAHARAI